MLAPAERLVLNDLIRPPDGYSVDRVIVTTYTLDLVSMLTLPLSISLRAGAATDESGRVDPIALLESVRRYAERITVVCEAGRIMVPWRGQALFGYLERSIMQVQAPRGGAFHPKVTIVRSVADDNATRGLSGGAATSTPAGEERGADGDDRDDGAVDRMVHYRVLCGTRNLTFDRSWDTMLVLEGHLSAGRTRAFSRNRPLARFVAALPGMAVDPPSARTKKVFAEIADELLRVRFEVPEGFHNGREDLRFHAIGIDAARADEWPFGGRIDRMLVMSPFVDRPFLERLSEQTTIAALIARSDELDALPAGAMQGVERAFVLEDAAFGEPSDDDPVNSASEAEQEETVGDQDLDRPRIEASRKAAGDQEDSFEVRASEKALLGLHAKLFIGDGGWDARIWTGSANATAAAFAKNVEFLVELAARKSHIGIEALLSERPSAGRRGQDLTFRDMLVPYTPPPAPVAPDPIQQQLERACDAARRALIAMGWIADIEGAESGPDGTPLYRLVLSPERPLLTSWPAPVQCRVRPISQKPEHGQALDPSGACVLSFGPLVLESITGFFAFHLQGEAEGQTFETAFVLGVRLRHEPEDRLARLLLSMLSNRERLLRYLLMLLDHMEFAIGTNGSGRLGNRWEFTEGGGEFGLPLLEPLLRTLAAGPDRLQSVESLVHDLEQTEQGRALLPADFLKLWDAVRAWRQERALPNCTATPAATATATINPASAGTAVRLDIEEQEGTVSIDAD